MSKEKDQPAVEEETGLDVDLGKAFDEVNKEEPEEKPETPKPAKAEEPEVEETPPEPVEETPVTEEETPAEEPESEESEKVVPPATWTAESKEKFNDLEPAIQQEVLKREKDFATGIEKNAQAAKLADAYEQVISPYKAMIAAEGSNPTQAVASLLNTAYQLRSGTPEQKTQLILGLAQQYGADLSQISPQTETDEYVDPDVLALKNEIASLKQVTQSQAQNTQNQQLMNYQQQIETFAADPKNVHFDKVRETMSSLLTSGTATTLDEAYNKSLYLVDDVRNELIQKQVKDAEASRIKKESDAAAKAKKAQSVPLVNEEAGIVDNAEGTMQDDLAAAFDKAQAS